MSSARGEARRDAEAFVLDLPLGATFTTPQLAKLLSINGELALRICWELTRDGILEALETGRGSANHWVRSDPPGPKEWGPYARQLMERLRRMREERDPSRSGVRPVWFTCWWTKNEDGWCNRCRSFPDQQACQHCGSDLVFDHHCLNCNLKQRIHK